MKKYTEVPWMVLESMPECVCFDTPEGKENLFTVNVDGYYCCQSTHDAHLIAAAPELLEALEQAETLLADYAADNCECKEGFCKPCAVRDMAEAAIKKAKGE